MAEELGDGQGLEVVASKLKGRLAPVCAGVVIREGREPVDELKDAQVEARGFKAVEALIKDPAVEVILKVTILAFIAGVAVLFVSILRERLYFWKKDRYKDVRR